MDKNKILDIGCGAGYFLDVSFKNGWKKCIGVDINNRYKKGYEDINGVQFINSPIEKFQKKFLVTTMIVLVYKVFSNIYMIWM